MQLFIFQMIGESTYTFPYHIRVWFACGLSLLLLQAHLQLILILLCMLPDAAHSVVSQPHAIFGSMWCWLSQLFVLCPSALPLACVHSLAPKVVIFFKVCMLSEFPVLVSLARLSCMLHLH